MAIHRSSWDGIIPEHLDVNKLYAGAVVASEDSDLYEEMASAREDGLKLDDEYTNFYINKTKKWAESNGLKWPPTMKSLEEYESRTASKKTAFDKTCPNCGGATEDLFELVDPDDEWSDIRCPKCESEFDANTFDDDFYYEASKKTAELITCPECKDEFDGELDHEGYYDGTCRNCGADLSRYDEEFVDKTAEKFEDEDSKNNNSNAGNAGETFSGDGSGDSSNTNNSNSSSSATARRRDAGIADRIETYTVYLPNDTSGVPGGFGSGTRGVDYKIRLEFPEHTYSVWTDDGEVHEEGFVTIEQAKEWAKFHAYTGLQNRFYYPGESYETVTLAKKHD